MNQVYLKRKWQQCNVGCVGLDEAFSIFIPHHTKSDGPSLIHIITHIGLYVRQESIETSISYGPYVCDSITLCRQVLHIYTMPYSS